VVEGRLTPALCRAVATLKTAPHGIEIMGFFDKIVSSFRGKEPEPPIHKPTPQQQVAKTAESKVAADLYPPFSSLPENSEERQSLTPASSHTNGNGNGAAQIKAPAASVVTNSVADTLVTPTAKASVLFDDLNDDDFDAVFDAAFDSAFGSSASADLGSVQQAATASDEAPVNTQQDQAEIAELFANIAANYASPIKNFIFELKRNVATKDWIEICLPAMRSISQAAASMDLKDAAVKMANFEEALLLAQTSPTNVLGGEERSLLMVCYDELVMVMPQAFTIGEEEQQREGIIINSLLKQIPDVGKVTLDKMYAAGLTTLNTLFLARKEELAVATGIPMRLSERICNKFQEYKTQLQSGTVQPGTAGKRERLTALVNTLKQQTEAYEAAARNEWADSNALSDKRRLRQERLETCHKINVVLAEIGEVELVKELQKHSFERRVESLKALLANMKDTN
jgi:hypothetical protein